MPDCYVKPMTLEALIIIYIYIVFIFHHHKGRRYGIWNHFSLVLVLKAQCKDALYCLKNIQQCWFQRSSEASLIHGFVLNSWWKICEFELDAEFIALFVILNYFFLTYFGVFRWRLGSYMGEFKWHFRVKDAKQKAARSRHSCTLSFVINSHECYTVFDAIALFLFVCLIMEHIH